MRAYYPEIASEPCPLPELRAPMRRLAAEGSVLLKNDGVLPFRKGDCVSLFGRCQEAYKKSGTGSGGEVRSAVKPDLLSALRENGVFRLNEELAQLYADWSREHPYDFGNGWQDPWSQEEMPVSEELVRSARARSDAAVILLQRSSGEGKDNTAEKGGFQLTDTERAMVELVALAFPRTAIVLNVSGLMDLRFTEELPIGAVLYVWQGGQEGALALADLLSGKISPSGGLPSTQARKLSDWPFYQNFLTPEVVYAEDIYVGYRYFESFAPERVLYPFGFGLSYTDFDIRWDAEKQEDEIVLKALVKNIGGFAAKRSLQVYYEAPCGVLGTPARALACFGKTRELAPGESEALVLRFPLSAMASYDEAGLTGFASAYVLQAGTYRVFAGTDVRSAACVLTHTEPAARLVRQCEEAMAPVQAFEHLRAQHDSDGRRKAVLVPARLQETDLPARVQSRRPAEIPYSGRRGLRLSDVSAGRCSLDDFIAQLTDNDLINLLLGEGMNSPRVTPNSGAAMGGVTEDLLDLGIPTLCLSDGPSGLRLGADGDCSSSLPDGFVFAASFDTALTEEIFRLEAHELHHYRVDLLLGPGMNIHKHPLCGRNFEYFSEDPVLSGQMAAAMSRGLASMGCSTTIKHCCCNNQEEYRNECMAIVSERALREIYLKGFEIAVREGSTRAIMTTYNPVNGWWNASNYDLCETLIRREWGFKGIIMTDWWARSNLFGEAGYNDNLKAMVRAHNDLFMVCSSTEGKIHNIYEGLSEGYITRGDLQYCAANVLRFILQSPTYARFLAEGEPRPERLDIFPADAKEILTLDKPESGRAYELHFKENEFIRYCLEFETDADPLTQLPVRIFTGGTMSISLSVSGGEASRIERLSRPKGSAPEIRLLFPPEVRIKRLRLYQ